MLCEMRGYDGSMSGWNGSHHGSADSSRGLCVFRKMEIGAYVVNSNQASGRNSYYQCENDSDVVLAQHESRHQGNPHSWRHELRTSKTYASQHLDKEYQKRRVERSSVHERHQTDCGSTSSHQNTMAEKYSGQQSNTTENNWVSTQELETTDGSVAGNIYQGPIVRVQVPEVYCEGGSTRDTVTAVVHKHKMNDGQVGQHLQGAREVYSSPVSETYRRINEWLKNCHQHSTKSSKTSQASHGSNHSRTENKPKQSTTPSNFSKADYRLHSQTGNASNLKLKPNEPRFVAALEPKAAKAENVVLQPNPQHKHRNTDWTEKHEVPFRHEIQGSAPRNNDVAISFSSNSNHAVNTTKPFYKSGYSKTSSEWSSETLSIEGSDDKSSYCTDFTPFELGSADGCGVIYQMDSMSTSAISHVMVDDRMRGKNVAQTKEFSNALPIGNEFAYNRKNDKNSFNSGWNNIFDQNSKQQRLQDRPTDQISTNSANFGASLHSSKAGSVVTVFIGDTQRKEQGNPHSDFTTKQGMGVQSNSRSQKAMTVTARSARDVQNLKIADGQNLKIADRRVFNGDRNSVQVPSETKLYTSDRKPIMPLRYTSLEHPLSSRITDRDHRFSIPADRSGFKESSSRGDAAFYTQRESRPVPQIRSGSLSITIRPNRLTVMDYFKKIDDVWDSAGRKAEPELKRTAEPPRDVESLQEIGDNTAADTEALDANDGIDGLNSGRGDAASDESEELDEFTKAVIKADVSASGKVLQSSSKTEFPSKPQYNVLKLSKNLKPEISTLLAGVHNRFSGKVYQILDDKNDESDDEKYRHLEEEAKFEGDIPLNAAPSSQEQQQDSRSTIDWHPGNLAHSPDRVMRVKSTKNEDLVDDRFGHNSEYMKCKYENILETPDFRSSSEKRYPEVNVLPTEIVSKTSCPEFQSFIRNHSDSYNYTSHETTTPNGSDRMHPGSDELYADERGHMATASPRPLLTVSGVVSDGFSSNVEPESVQCSNKSNEEDRFLMSLLQSQTPDLTKFESSCTPRLQSRNLDRTSDCTVRTSCKGNSEHMSFTAQSDKDAALKSVMKSPKRFEQRSLQDEEPSRLDFKLLTYGIHESRGESGRDNGEEYCRQKSGEREYSRKSLEDSPDSLSSVFVEGAAAPAMIPKYQNSESDSMTHKDSAQHGNSSFKISESRPGSSFIINNTVKNSEPMYCQELIDFPENLVIDPPESFSDFTIML